MNNAVIISLTRTAVGKFGGSLKDFSPGQLGSVVLKDGGASGNTKITLNVFPASTGADYTLLPGEGLLFQTNIYADITTIASVTVIYG